jgi:hypothetical protein
VKKLLLSLLLLGGCGYSSNSYNWGGLYRADISTMAVPVFQTRSFARGEEIALTQALINQIEQRTPYKVVPRDQAETVLEGIVTQSRVTTISNDSITALPQEQLYNITIDFVWKDLRTGRVIVERRGFRQSSTFYSTLGEGRNRGSQTAVEGLASSIVTELQRDF